MFFELGEKEAILLKLLQDNEIKKAKEFSVTNFGQNVVDQFIKELYKNNILQRLSLIHI